MVEVIGTENVRRSLERLNGEVERIVKAEVRTAAINIQSGARQLCPVDTGRLRNSITHEVRAAGLKAVVGTNVRYAVSQEFGTRYAPAQPSFLLPALEQERTQFRSRLIQAVDAAARRIAALVGPSNDVRSSEGLPCLAEPSRATPSLAVPGRIWPSQAAIRGRASWPT